MRPLFIFGSSGHARDVADVAAALAYRPIFVVEAGGPAPADEETVGEADVERYAAEAFAIGIGANHVRRRVAERYGGSLNFVALIHPDTSFGRGQREIVAGTPGTVIFPGVRFTSGIRLGRFCNINLNATISHDVRIGDFVNISPGAHITGNVDIGDEAWIGIGVAVNQGMPGRPIRIGARCTVGSGAVVVADCDPDSVYVGVPARKRL